MRNHQEEPFVFEQLSVNELLGKFPNAPKSVEFPSAYHLGIETKARALLVHRRIVDFILSLGTNEIYAVLRESKRFNPARFPYEVKVAISKRYSEGEIWGIIEELGIILAN